MDVEPYRKLIEERFQKLQINTLAPIVEGWDNLVLEVNGELIFRFPRRPENEVQLEKEISLLPELSKVISLPVPKFEYVCEGDGDTPFVGYRKIRGIPLTADIVRSGNGQRLAVQLAGFLSELHHFPVIEAVRLKVPDASPAQWREEYQDFYARVRTLVFPLLDARSRAEVAALWEGFLRDEVNFQFERVLLHRDLSSDHILCDPARGVITGIIDWGDASIGDPAFDFSGLVSGYGLDFAERVLAEYQGKVDETFLNRSAFYARLVPFHEILFGLATSDHGHLKRGLVTLQGDLS